MGRGGYQSRPAKGDVTSWAAAVQPWNYQGEGFGMGLDFGDIDGNGLADMVVSYKDNSNLNGEKRAIRIGWDIGSSGSLAGWSRTFYVGRTGYGWGASLGVGMAIHQFGSLNPRLGLMFVGILPVTNNDEIRYIWA